jgi:hypothetical protein
VIRFADDEVPEAAPEQTAAVPPAAAASVSASSAPSAAPVPASSPAIVTASKLPDLRRDKEEESLSVETVPVPTPKPTTLQQKMLAMAGQDIDQFMREVSCVISLILILTGTEFVTEVCLLNITYCLKLRVYIYTQHFRDRPSVSFGNNKGRKAQ